MYEAIKDLILIQLESSDLEDRFRIEAFARDKSLTIIVMGITLILLILFIGLDMFLWGENEVHSLWVPSRVVASIATVVGIWLVQKQSDAKNIDRINLIWGIVDICHLLIINSTRLTDYYPIILWDILTIFGIFFLIPLPFHLKLFLAFFLTGGSGIIWCLYRIPIVDSYETVAILSAYLIANIYGIFVSRRDDQVRRQHFVLLLEETKTRKELSDRTIELEKTQNELQLLAMTDTLTGVSNRRHFIEQISRELERAKRYGHPLSIFILDIDNLKDINDRYGHDAGDELLKSVSKQSSALLRSNDHFARFGGDEFVALLVQTDRVDAERVAERIRKSIEDLELNIDQTNFRTSVSIGMAIMTDEIVTVEELIKRSDTALYKAKEGGRNQVVCL